VLGLFGQEEQDQLTQDHVSHQAHVTLALEVSQTHLIFGQAEQVLDLGPMESHAQRQTAGLSTPPGGHRSLRVYL
jgi:hypothetical protein